MTDADSTNQEPSARHPGPTELAAALAARLCHDLISPASAVVSGVDLLEDPESQDLREEAIGLITGSARKLAALLSFCRVAYGASAAADTFDTRELRVLTEGVYAHHKADLDWQVGLESLPKPAARAILNMAEIGAGCLARGGTVIVAAEQNGEGLLLDIKAVGERVRLRAEVATGLSGKPLEEGLQGPWVQAYYLSRLLAEAGGRISFEADEASVSMQAVIPL